MLGNPSIVAFDPTTAKWTLNETRIDKEFKAISNVLNPLPTSDQKGIRIIPWGPRGWWEKTTPFNPVLQFQPYALTADKKKFDLTKFNSFYFPIVKRVIQIARKYGMRTWYCWMDNCQFFPDPQNSRRWSPWVTNAQSISTFYEPKAYPFLKTWIQKCYDEFAGLYVYWPWGNETTPSAFRDVAKNVIYPMITKLSIPARSMTYGAIMTKAKYAPSVPPPDGPYLDTNDTQSWLKADVEDALGKSYKLGIWKEVHGIGRAGYPTKPNELDQAITWWARTVTNGIRIWISDDGTKNGDSACDVATDGARPSASRWTSMVKATKPFANDFCYEHLPQNETEAGLSCQIATMKSIYKTIYGTNPIPKY